MTDLEGIDTSEPTDSDRTWRIECDEVDIMPGIVAPGDQRFYLDDEQVTKEQFDAAMNKAHDTELSP